MVKPAMGPCADIGGRWTLPANCGGIIGCVPGNGPPLGPGMGIPGY